ncbi:hypothetical protein M408DRAFT_23648, partial [Serendipita vermifera MAFF 305830]
MSVTDAQQRRPPKQRQALVQSIHNPYRYWDHHHMLYKELIPYYDFNFLNSHIYYPQSTLQLPLSSSHSHRTILTPLELRYVASSTTPSSSRKPALSYAHGNATHAAAADSEEHGRDILPSDALRHLYRLAERVYSHLSKSGHTHVSANVHHVQNGMTHDSSIESTARPAARDGGVYGPARSSYGLDGREGSIADSVSSLYSQNTLANSTLIDESESMYGSFRGEGGNGASNAKLAALSAALEKAQNQLAYERSAREEADSVIAALRGEVGKLSGKLERADKALDAAKKREKDLQTQYATLNGSICDLKKHLVDEEPAWAKALRAEVLASVTGLSSTTSHSFTGISKDLKHQHHEITQLGERTSKLATSHEAVVRDATHNVQHHLSTKLDRLVAGQEHSTAALVSLDEKVKGELPVLSIRLGEVKSVVDRVDAGLGKYEASLGERHADVKQTLHHAAEASLANHAQTGKLVQELDGKLLQYNAEVLASVTSLSTSTAHSFTGITKDIKHQHHEIKQLSEQTTKLASSHDTVIHETTRGVQNHLSSKLNVIAAEITANHGESLSAISSMEGTVKGDMPALAKTVKEVKHVVDCVDSNFARYETSSNERHADVKQMFHQATEASWTNHQQTSKLVQGLDNKLQQYIANSADVAYANVAARSKANPGNEGSDPGPIVVAIESMKALVSASMSSIQQAIEHQQTDVSKLVSQVSSQTSNHETLSKSSESTSVILKELQSKASHSEKSHSEALVALNSMRETLSTLSATSWFEQGADSCGLSRQKDVLAINDALKELSTQVYVLGGDGDASSLTLGDLMTQLSDLSTRLASIEIEVQNGVTAAVVVEEISSIKSVRSLEHQADLAAGERLRETVLGLDEFVRGQLDQVNAALDEQQSRLVSIQSTGKQHAEDSKAISLMVEENGELLRGIESQSTQSHGASAKSTEEVRDMLEEIKSQVVALRESDSARVQTLADTPRSPPVNDEIKELCKSIHELVESVPKRVHAESAERHDTLLAKNAELVALLTALSAALAQLSKDTHGLNDTLAKVDSSLVERDAAVTKRSTTSQGEISSIVQIVSTLEKEILAVRERVFASPLPNGTPDPAAVQQSIALTSKLDALMTELTGTKAALCEEISGARAQSENETQQLNSSLEEVKGSIEKLSSSSDQGIVALQSAIEKQSGDLLAVRDEVSSSQSSGSTEVTKHLNELVALVRSNSSAEILERVRELGVSVSDIHGHVVDQSNSTATASSLSEIQRTLEAYASQLNRVLKTEENHSGRHDTIVALLERNQTKISEMYESVQSNSSSQEIISLRSVIEKQTSDLMAVKEQMSSTSSSSSTEVTKQLSDLTTLVQSLSFAEVLEHLRELSVSVTDVRGLVVEETKSSSTTSSNFSEIQKMLEVYAGQLAQLLKNEEGHSSRHESLVALLDRNQAKISEVYEGVHSSSSEQAIRELRSVIERQTTDLVAVKEQISTSHSTSSTEVTKHLSEITTLIQSISFTEVLERLQELGISVTDVRGLIVNESQSDTTTASSLSEIQKASCSMLEVYAGHFEQVLKSEQNQSSRHDAIIALLDRNQSKISELYEGIHSSSSEQTIIALRSLIEKQSTDLLAVREQISTSQSTSSTEVTNQLNELTTLVQRISFAEVLQHLHELGVSVTDVRGLIVDESKSSMTTSASLTEVQKMLGVYASQFEQVLKHEESHSSRHDTVVALLDRSQTKISEVYEGIQSHVTSTRELVSESHTSAMSSLEKITTILATHEAYSKEHCTEIIKATRELQQYLSEKGDKQSADITAKLSDLSQSFVELLSSQTFSSQSLREGVTQLTDSSSRLNTKMDTRFKETVDTLNQAFESLRVEMTK